MHEIELLTGKKKTKKNKKTRKVVKIFLYLFVFMLVATTFFSSHLLISDNGETSWIAKLPIISHIRNLAESADKKLKGENRKQINILLLGMGGKNHDGGTLTDTIMLATLDLEDKKNVQASLVSIPRDLSVPVEDLGWRKINNINAFAEAKNSGSGGLAVSQALSDILKTPIDYYVRIDFAGFVNIIDIIGGVDVYVENTLEDFRYPIMGREEAEPYESRFEHLFLEKGWQKMDGSLALKYARSRHAGGVEGSDFARARRQQRILLAAKSKLLSLGTLFNPKKVSDILEEVNNHVNTNLKIWEIIKLWNFAKEIDKENIVSRVLDNSPGGLLVDKITAEGAYILTPRSGDFSEIQYLTNNIFSDAPEEEKLRVAEEMATVEVINGTWINGLASKTALDLEKYGFHVVRIGNSSRQNFQKTVIYDLNYGEKPKSIKILKNALNANVSFGLPEWLIEDLENEIGNDDTAIKPDFIIILGHEADETASGAENINE